MIKFKLENDFCQGDSGGPLICGYDGKATLVEILSRGVGCADPNSAGIYSWYSSVKIKKIFLLFVCIMRIH